MMNKETDHQGDSSSSFFFLKRLREGNEARREELGRLQEEYERETANNDDRPQSTPIAGAALQIELDLLKEQNQNRHLPTALLPPKDRPSEWQMNEFAHEVLESYQDLAETQSTLEMVLQREKHKLQVKRAFVEQQRELLESLKQQQQLLPTGKTVGEENEEISLENKQKENEWIRQELKYVCQKLLPAPTKDDGTSANSRRKKRKKKQQNGDNQNINPLEKVVLDLTQRLLEDCDPKNAFLTLEAAGQDQGKMAELLVQCGVAKSHPNDNKKLRLTDYRC